MSFEVIANKITEAKARVEELKKTYAEEMQTEFQKVAKVFFEEVPAVQAVVWSQYTPYFNDGDECVFSVHEPEFVTENFDPDDPQAPYEYGDEDEYKSISAWAKDFRMDEKLAIVTQSELDKIYAFADIITKNEDMMKEIYGDHVAVYLTKDETIVQKYSHD